MDIWSVFHVLAIVNNVSMNIAVKVCLSPYFFFFESLFLNSFGYIPTSSIAKSYGACF